MGTSKNSSGTPRESGVRPGVIITIVAVALVAGAVTIYRVRSGRNTSQDTATQTVDTKPPTNHIASLTERKVAAPTPALTSAVSPPVLSETSKPAPTATAPARQDPTAYTRQLVTALSKMDVSSGSISPEKAEEWKGALVQLVQQGAASVPAIREFLETNQDVNFETLNGGTQLGQTSLRMAMLNALHAIGGPEAIELSAQTMQTATDPREIAALATYLETQSPAQYTQQALDAARRSLALASAGTLQGKDVGPLFNVFQQYGGANALADLSNASAQWKYYSAIAMVNLADGAGVSALVKMAQPSPEVSKSTQMVALQMLAQVAGKYPEARSTLIEQARQNQIADLNWLELASVLGGHTFQIGNQPMENPPTAAGGPKIKGYHLAYGNQNFYSVENNATWTPDQINERVSLINDLLKVTTSPIANEALQKSRTTLLSRVQQ